MKTNKLVQLKQSKIHNFGLYAKRDIAEDTPIIQYVGEKMTHKQADKRVGDDEHELIYFFTLDDKYVIDGDVDYNLAKYINHSCEPNCYNDIHDGEVWIYAMRDIKKGEELSYDYGFHRSDWQHRICNCGMDDCFGFVVAHEYWPAIRKTKRYKQLKKK